MVRFHALQLYAVLYGALQPTRLATLHTFPLLLI